MHLPGVQSGFILVTSIPKICSCQERHFFFSKLFAETEVFIYA